MDLRPERTGSSTALSRWVGLVVVLGAICSTAALGFAEHQSRPPLLALGAVLAIAVVGDAGIVPLRLGVHRVELSWTEAALMLGFALSSVPWTVLLTLCAFAGWEAWRRKRSMQRALFNLAAVTVAAGLGGLVVAWMPRSELVRPAGWPYLATAALVADLAAGVMVSTAIALSSGKRPMTVLLANMRARLLVWGLTSAAAIALLATWDYDPGLLLALPPILFAARVLTAQYMRTETKLDALSELGDATRTIPGLEEAGVLAAISARAADLLESTDITVLLLDDATPGGVRVFEFTSLGSGFRPARADETVALARSDSLDVAHSVAVVPLAAGLSHIGVLRASLPSSELGTSERQLVTALAATAASSLLNAYMYSALRTQADHLVTAVEEKAHEARHDPLTGLGNRSMLLGDGTTALSMVTEAHPHVGLLLLDLDHFKEVNDTLGHHAGDLMLIEVARRLRAAMAPHDLVIRLGGDEFAVLITRLDSPAHLRSFGDTVLEQLHRPMSIEGLRLTVEGSVGMACYPGDADTISGLMRCADVAMYEAKKHGHTARRYDTRRDPTSAQRLAIIGELEAGVISGELVLHYQPKVDLDTMRIVGAEALVRWQHPRRGLLSPAEFISAVEHSSLIDAFTLEVLGQAIRDAAEWEREHGPSAPHVAVNVSARNLLDDRLPGNIALLLEQHGMSPDRLTLEITETLALTELDVADDVLRQLREQGIRLAVDDFGTGYSSLTFLQRVAVHEVKIDRSFVARLATDGGDRVIVEATLGLAHKLGMRSVAEGVENAQQLAILRDLRCDLAQGFFLGRPMPAAAFQRLLANGGQQLPNRGRALYLAPVPENAMDLPVQPMAPVAVRPPTTDLGAEVI